MSLPTQNHRQDREYVAPEMLDFQDSSKPHTFLKPAKRINEGHDVAHFLTSQAYRDIGIFVMQLNVAMCPRKGFNVGEVNIWPLDSVLELSEPVRKLQNLVQSLNLIIDEVPPTTTGPRRFGNSSFREWYSILESRVRSLLQTHLTTAVLDFSTDPKGDAVLDELTPYLMGSFGSPERLDFGTGHELSFLAFLGCIWKLGGFSTAVSDDGALERSIVIGVIEPYLRFIRRLIVSYTLEPAGSHGVWGLDDHFFLSYIFGSAQYCPAIKDGDDMPREGSLPGVPHTSDIVKKVIVQKERTTNMYFSAIGFINDVKTGPFWEHSPILFDISGVRAGWGKINKGMIKMYNAEVLSKFPVVQHFPFGSLFRWDKDPNAEQPRMSAHALSHPIGDATSTGITGARDSHDAVRPLWGNGPTSPTSSVTAAPWAQAQAQNRSDMPQTAAPWVRSDPRTDAPHTAAPWSSSGSGQSSLRMPGNSSMPPPADRPTRAPWANPRGSGA